MQWVHVRVCVCLYVCVHACVCVCMCVCVCASYAHLRIDLHPVWEVVLDHYGVVECKEVMCPLCHVQQHHASAVDLFNKGHLVCEEERMACSLPLTAGVAMSGAGLTLM